MLNPRSLGTITRVADKGSYSQSGLSGPGSNIQNCVPAANQPVLDQSLRDRRKHQPDVCAVLLPEWRGITPSVDELLVGLHPEKYTDRAYGESENNLEIRIANPLFRPERKSQKYGAFTLSGEHVHRDYADTSCASRPD